MKPPAPGSKAADVRRLRELRYAQANLKRETGVVPTPKPIPAPVKASAPIKETAMKKKLKTKSAAPKRSVSEAAANLRAAKTAAKATKKAGRSKARQPVGGADKSGPRPGSKVAAVAALLGRPDGCTAAEILKETGWPSVSVPAQAKAAGLTLSKEKIDGVTRYRGVPAAA